MKPVRVEPDYCSVPRNIMERYKNLTFGGGCHVCVWAAFLYYPIKGY